MKSSILLAFNLVLLTAVLIRPATSAAGGRSGTGGDGTCNLSPEQLRAKFPGWDGKYGNFPNPPALSKIDPTPRIERSDPGCGIPTGELEVRMPKPMEFPPARTDETACFEPSLPGVVTESRIAPADGCRAVQIWSFVRSAKNQLKYHSAPSECKLFSALGEDPYSGSTCQKMPFFRSREAADRAKAQAPFAYAENDKVVIEYGSLFFTSSREILASASVDGKVRGELQSRVDPKAMDLSESFQPRVLQDGAASLALSDSRIKFSALQYPTPALAPGGALNSMGLMAEPVR